ncbi:hypothetical protein [Allocoleopsis sp.]
MQAKIHKYRWGWSSVLVLVLRSVRQLQQIGLKKGDGDGYTIKNIYRF